MNEAIIGALCTVYLSLWIIDDARQVLSVVVNGYYSSINVHIKVLLHLAAISGFSLSVFLIWHDLVLLRLLQVCLLTVIFVTLVALNIRSKYLIFPANIEMLASLGGPEQIVHKGAVSVDQHSWGFEVIIYKSVLSNEIECELKRYVPSVWIRNIITRIVMHSIILGGVLAATLYAFLLK